MQQAREIDEKYFGKQEAPPLEALHPESQQEPAQHVEPAPELEQVRVPDEAAAMPALAEQVGAVVIEDGSSTPRKRKAEVEEGMDHGQHAAAADVPSTTAHVKRPQHRHSKGVVDDAAHTPPPTGHGTTGTLNAASVLNLDDDIDLPSPGDGGTLLPSAPPDLIVNTPARKRSEPKPRQPRRSKQQTQESVLHLEDGDELALPTPPDHRPARQVTSAEAVLHNETASALELAPPQTPSNTQHRPAHIGESPTVSSPFGSPGSAQVASLAQLMRLSGRCTLPSQQYMAGNPGPSPGTSRDVTSMGSLPIAPPMLPLTTVSQSFPRALFSGHPASPQHDHAPRSVSTLATTVPAGTVAQQLPVIASLLASQAPLASSYISHLHQNVIAPSRDAPAVSTEDGLRDALWTKSTLERLAMLAPLFHQFLLQYYPASRPLPTADTLIQQFRSSLTASLSLALLPDVVQVLLGSIAHRHMPPTSGQGPVPATPAATPAVINTLPAVSFLPRDPSSMQQHVMPIQPRSDGDVPPPLVSIADLNTHHPQQPHIAHELALDYRHASPDMHAIKRPKLDQTRTSTHTSGVPALLDVGRPVSDAITRTFGLSFSNMGADDRTSLFKRIAPNTSVQQESAASRGPPTPSVRAWDHATGGVSPFEPSHSQDATHAAVLPMHAQEHMAATEQNIRAKGRKQSAALRVDSPAYESVDTSHAATSTTSKHVPPDSTHKPAGKSKAKTGKVANK